eukprot:m.22572 g.22572  ORF g.22572 m.22572 type:complete len:430 (+) comp28359_c0_seq4:94-1383(+)
MRSKRKCAEVASIRLSNLRRRYKHHQINSPRNLVRVRTRSTGDESNDTKTLKKDILSRKSRSSTAVKQKLIKSKVMKKRKPSSSSSSSSSKMKSEKGEKASSANGIKRNLGEYVPVEFSDDLTSLHGLVPAEEISAFEAAQQEARVMLEEEQAIVESGQGLKYIHIGQYEVETWYSSPYPEQYQHLHKIFICEYCLSYFGCRLELDRHALQCKRHHPPGSEIYRKGDLSVFEVDGAKATDYCRNLCLLAKLFLDHKTLYYEVEPFLFYNMTKCDSEGCHTVGYFSKEKDSLLKYNLSCILTLPQHMRKGYGRLLIDFSYLLSRVEGKVGSPEKPLSDLGLLSYRSYWKDVVLNYLANLRCPMVCFKDLSLATGISQYDIISTLQSLGMVKYWKGQHIVLKSEELVGKHYGDKKKAKSRYLDPDRLEWPL